MIFYKSYKNIRSPEAPSSGPEFANRPRCGHPGRTEHKLNIITGMFHRDIRKIITDYVLFLTNPDRIRPKTVSGA